MSQTPNQSFASVGSPMWLPISQASTSGSTGPTGPARPGPTGPQGPGQGFTGPTGPEGNGGPQGSPGANGLQVPGPAGPVGVTGATGPIGATGPAGSVGATGPGYSTLSFDSNVVIGAGSVYQRAFANLSLTTYPTGIYAFKLDCSASPLRSMYQEFLLQNISRGPTDINDSYISFVLGNNPNVDPEQTVVNYINASNSVIATVDPNSRSIINISNVSSNTSDTYTWTTYLIAPYPY